MVKGLIVVSSAFLLAACDAAVEHQMDNIYTQVADDAVAQYEIAKRQGDPIQTCVQAGMVSAAYLQAQDESSYNKWKAIEKADCAQAGMPM